MLHQDVRDAVGWCSGGATQIGSLVELSKDAGVIRSRIRGEWCGRTLQPVSASVRSVESNRKQVGVVPFM